MIRSILWVLTPRGRRLLVGAVIGFVVYALCGTAMMLIAITTVEAVMNHQANLLQTGVVLVALLVVKALSGILADKQKHLAGFDLIHQLRARVIRRLRALSLGYYTKERLGEISEIIHNDVDAMEMVVAHLWTRMIADFIVSLTLFIALVVYDWRMALLMMSTLPFAIAWLTIGVKKANHLEKQAGDRAADMTALFVEFIRGMPVLKAFTASDKLETRLGLAITDFQAASTVATKNKAFTLTIYSFLVDLAFWVVVSVGLFMTLGGWLPVLSYLIFVVIGREFYKPFTALETHWMNYVKVSDSYMRIQKVMQAPAVPQPRHPAISHGSSICFEQVTFAYEPGRNALNKVSFTVPEGTLTALVGESGSGKTTITNLLLRFWDTDEGSITVGGVDVRDMDYDDLMSRISIVMQNVQLFADTIEGNIRIGNTKASRAEVIAAAKLARIHDFITTLPDGYGTMVGENGVGLSGGQRQRIAVARAFLKDAPILIMDEVTANVDPVNETKMQQAITELARNRTVLVVAHHLTTVRSADQILVLQNGHIAERGTHDELLKHSGIYQHLWVKQPASATNSVSQQGSI